MNESRIFLHRNTGGNEKMTENRKEECGKVCEKVCKTRGTKNYFIIKF